MLDLAAVLMVRNEASYLGEFLDYYQPNVPRGFWVYDDASTDNTWDVLMGHPAVAHVITAEEWDNNMLPKQHIGRALAYRQAVMCGAEWCLCLDADEYVHWDWQMPAGVDAVRMRLWDFYITPDDERYGGSQHLAARHWIGPEYRDVLMLWRMSQHVEFRDREPRLPAAYLVGHSGEVAHYGKARSVEEWEQKCEFYYRYWPEPYRTKWHRRRGKAVHTISDFGLPLCRWEDRHVHAVELTRELEQSGGTVP